MNNEIIWIIIVGFGLLSLVSIITQLRTDIVRMNTTLDKIAKHVGVPDIVTEDIKDELKSLISEGKNVKAIKKYRMLTGLGLKEAKEYVDRVSTEK